MSTVKPRQLLEREGFDLVEMAEAEACCGFGGKVVLDYPELPKSVLQRKLDSIEATGMTLWLLTVHRAFFRSGAV